MPFFVSYDDFVLSLLLRIENRFSEGSKISDHQNCISPCRHFQLPPQPAGIMAIMEMKPCVLTFSYTFIFKYELPLTHILTLPLFISIYWNHTSRWFFWVCPSCDPAESTFVDYWSIRFQFKHICHHRPACLFHLQLLQGYCSASVDETVFICAAVLFFLFFWKRCGPEVGFSLKDAEFKCFYEEILPVWLQVIHIKTPF